MELESRGRPPTFTPALADLIAHGKYTRTYEMRGPDALVRCISAAWGFHASLADLSTISDFPWIDFAMRVGALDRLQGGLKMIFVTVQRRVRPARPFQDFIYEPMNAWEPDRRAEAFTPEFQRRLASGDASTSWAATLSEYEAFFLFHGLGDVQARISPQLVATDSGPGASSLARRENIVATLQAADELAKAVWSRE